MTCLIECSTLWVASRATNEREVRSTTPTGFSAKSARNRLPKRIPLGGFKALVIGGLVSVFISLPAFAGDSAEPLIQRSEVIPADKGSLEVYMSQYPEQTNSPTSKVSALSVISANVRTTVEYRYVSSRGIAIIATARLDKQGVAASIDLPDGRQIFLDHTGDSKRRIELSLSSSAPVRALEESMREAITEFQSELLSNPRLSQTQSGANFQTRNALGCWGSLVAIDAAVLAAYATCGACPVTGLTCLGCIGSLAGGLAAGLGALAACGDALGGDSGGAMSFVCVEHPDHPTGYVCWREGANDKVEIQPDP